MRPFEESWILLRQSSEVMKVALRSQNTRNFFARIHTSIRYGQSESFKFDPIILIGPRALNLCSDAAHSLTIKIVIH